MKKIATWRCSTKISKTNLKTKISPLLTRPQGCQDTSIRLSSSAIVIYTSYHSTNRQRSNISHDSPLPKTKESYHPFKKKLFTTLQKQLQSTFSYNCSKKKNWVTFTLKNERLDLKITRWFAVHYPIFRISICKPVLSLSDLFMLCSEIQASSPFCGSSIRAFLIKTVFPWSQKTSYPYLRGFIVPVWIWYVAAVEILKKTVLFFVTPPRRWKIWYKLSQVEVFVAFLVCRAPTASVTTANRANKPRYHQQAALIKNL